MQRRAALGLLLLLLASGCTRRRRRAYEEPVTPTLIELTGDARTDDASAMRESDAAPETAERREGALTVPAEPRDEQADRSLRLRTTTDVDSVGGYRLTWTGPRVPSWMPLSQGRALLSSLDVLAAGWFALYRAPLNAPGDLAVAVRFDGEGRVAFRHELSAIGPGPSLEITDAVLDDDTIFFVRSCHSYAREERSRCSYLVALDAATGRARWASQALTARGFITMVTARYIVVHYAFSREPSYVTVLRKSDGRVAHRLALRTRNFLEPIEGEPEGDARTIVAHGSGTIEQRLTVTGLDGDRPRIAFTGPQTGEPDRGPTLQFGDHD